LLKILFKKIFSFFKEKIYYTWLKISKFPKKREEILFLCFSFIFLFLPLVFFPKIKPFTKQKDFSFLDNSSKILTIQSNQLFLSSQKVEVEPSDFNIIQKNSFYVLAVLTDSEQEDFSQKKKEIIEYIVQPDDNLNIIAEKFGISLKTILWANNLTEESKIHSGQKLIILPVSGVLHQVKEGETLSEIADFYKGKVKDIIAFNELSDEKDIYIGDSLIIPNGVLPEPTKKQNITKEQKIKDNLLEEVPLLSNYFIYPTVSHRLSQGLHWHNAVDFDGECGDPIYAPAQGIVLKKKFGWNLGLGNYLTILHPNGAVTMYAHLESIVVDKGNNVSQGQIIAYMGGQPGSPGAGNSTGCHLHFDVSNAKNPFANSKF